MTRRAVFHEDAGDTFDDGVNPLTDFPTTDSPGVDSLAKSGDTPLTGDVTLSEGTNVTLTQVGQDIEIAAAGGGATFGTPAIVLGTAAANGAIDEVIRRDSTIVAFDATAPSTQAFGDAAAVGAAAVAARRDHKHAMPTATDVQTAYDSIIDIVSQAEAEAGTSTTAERWTPERVAQAIAALGFAPDVAIQVKTDTSGTYTPTAGMVKVLVICVGGGGGAPAETAADAAVSGGGGGGAAIKLFSAATIGASQAYAVGQSSTGAGNTSGLGTANALLQATGGAIGVSTGNATTLGTATQGGLGGIGTLGDLNIRGGPGGDAVIYGSAAGKGGMGGNSILGGGGRGGITITTFQDGEAGGAYGGGAGGGHTSNGTDLAAVAGAGGVIYFIEFLKTGGGAGAAAEAGASELIYRYTVVGSDKASIDTGVDTADAGSLDWTNGDVLEVFIVGRTDDAAADGSFTMIVNNDTGNNYDNQSLGAVNASVTAAASVAQANWAINCHGSGGTAGYATSLFMKIPGYADTVFNKTAVLHGDNPDGTAGNNRISGRGLGWRSTAAITRLKIAPGGGGTNFKVGTKLLVYKRRSV